VTNAVFAVVLALLAAFAAFGHRADRVLMRAPIRTRDVRASAWWRLASIVSLGAACVIVGIAVACHVLQATVWSRS
jgi:hypothetical protein